jgi:hypothetical protein
MKLTEREIESIREARFLLVQAYNRCDGLGSPAQRKVSNAWQYLDAAYIYPYEAALLADDEPQQPSEPLDSVERHTQGAGL